MGDPTKMPQVSLTTLPLEVLIEICKSLCWHCQTGDEEKNTTPWATNGAQSRVSIESRKDQVALVSLSRTCKILHAAAEPILYHYLHTSTVRDLRSFVRTFHKRPDLGPRVAEVEVIDGSGGGPPPPRRSRYIRRLPGQTQAQAQAQEQEKKPENPDEPSELDEPGGLLSLVLKHAPNMTRARFPLVGYANYKPLAQLTVPLTLLKRLVLDSFSQGILHIFNLSIIRLAPNLEVLHCYEYSEPAPDFPAVPLLENPLPLQNLTELRLMGFNLSAEAFSKLLRGVGPKLSKVCIRPKVMYISMLEEDIRFDDALVALRPWHKTLTELTFSMYNLMETRQQDRVELLREFQSLQVLEAEVDFFDFDRTWGVLTSKLPHSVREIKLLGYGSITMGLDGLFHSLVAGRFPELRRVEIDDQSLQPGSLVVMPELEKVAASFSSRGVDFVIHRQRRQYYMAPQFGILNWS